jgi:hypothetical protein
MVSEHNSAATVDVTNEHKPIRWRALKISVALVLAWAVYVGSGLPLTTVDDLFFFGAADTWQQTGELTNRLMTEEYLDGFPSKAYYFHPPIYTAFLAAWLKVFQASELSLQTFAFSNYLIGLFGLWLTARRLKVSATAIAVIGLLYVLSVSRLGLRPEIMAFSLLFLGAGLMLGATKTSLFFGWLCLGLSVACYPITAPMGMAFVVFSYWMWPATQPRKLLLFAASSISAGLAMVVLSGQLINWQIADFLHCYRLTGEAVNPGPLFSPSRYLNYWEVLSTKSRFLPKWPFVLLGPLLLVPCTILGAGSTRKLAYCWLFVLGVIGAAGITHLRAADISIFGSLAITTIILDEKVRGRVFRFGAFSSVVALGLAANIMVVVTVLFQTRNPPQVDPDLAQLRAGAPLGRRMLIDSVTARYLFDWQLGPRVFDFRTSRPLLGSEETRIYPRDTADIREDEIWIVTSDFSHATKNSPTMPQSVVVFGRTLGMVNRYAFEPVVIKPQPGEHSQEQTPRSTPAE